MAIEDLIILDRGLYTAEYMTPTGDYNGFPIIIDEQFYDPMTNTGGIKWHISMGSPKVCDTTITAIDNPIQVTFNFIEEGAETPTNSITTVAFSGIKTIPITASSAYTQTFYTEGLVPYTSRGEWPEGYTITWDITGAYTHKLSNIGGIADVEPKIYTYDWTAAPLTGTVWDINTKAQFRKSKVSCDSQYYLGDYANINIEFADGAVYHTLQMTCEGLTVDIETQTPDTQITGWIVPQEIRNQMAANDTFIECQIHCITYIQDEQGIYMAGTDTTKFLAKLDVYGMGPIFNPVITVKGGSNDPDNQITSIIKGVTDVRIYPNVIAQDYWIEDFGTNIIESVYVYNAGEKINGMYYGNSEGYYVEFTDCKSGNFKLVATDAGGLTTSHAIELTAYDYHKPVLIVRVETTGDIEDPYLTLYVEGTISNTTPGNSIDSLTFKCFDPKYYSQTGYYREGTLTYEVDENGNFTATQQIYTSDYKGTYEVTVSITDTIGFTTTKTQQASNNPIWDMRQSDMNFYVPVHFVRNIEMDMDYAITGQPVNEPNFSETIEAFVPYASDDSVRIGFGLYNKEKGSTKIYGHTIDLISNEGITVNGEPLGVDTSVQEELVDKMNKLYNALQNSYSFTPTVTINDTEHWNIQVLQASCALTLRGNCLYCRFYVNFSYEPGDGEVGDIEDAFCGRVSFNHGGKITGMDYVDGVTGTSGTTAAMSIRNIVVNDTTAQFDVFLPNMADPGYAFMSCFTIPVSINVDKFTT